MTRSLTHWTVEDYHRMIASGALAGRQVELVDGQILDVAPELSIHRVAYRRGAKSLEELLGDRAVVFATAPITLPPGITPGRSGGKQAVGGVETMIV